MALARWWKPFTRTSRPGPATSGFTESSVAAPIPAPPPQRPAEAPPAASATAAGAPASLDEAGAVVDPPLSNEERTRFLRWIVGVADVAGTSGLPDLVVQHLMERLDEVIASMTSAAKLPLRLPRSPL